MGRRRESSPVAGVLANRELFCICQMVEHRPTLLRPVGAPITLLWCSNEHIGYPGRPARPYCSCWVGW